MRGGSVRAEPFKQGFRRGLFGLSFDPPLGLGGLIIGKPRLDAENRRMIRAFA